jgi:hypothetical protein
MAGWFTFVGPRDLLAKLERERRAIQLDPLDADMALNLCMTGFHLYWLLPGDANKTARSALIDAEPLLQTWSLPIGRSPSVSLESTRCLFCRDTTSL